MLITSKLACSTAPNVKGYGEDKPHKPSGLTYANPPIESRDSGQPMHAITMQHWLDQRMSDGPFAIVNGQSTRQILQRDPDAFPSQVEPSVSRSSNSTQNYKRDSNSVANSVANQGQHFNQTQAYKQTQGVA